MRILNTGISLQYVETLCQNINCINSSSNHLVSVYTYICKLKIIVDTGNIPIEQESKVEIYVYLHMYYKCVHIMTSKF